MTYMHAKYGHLMLQDCLYIESGLAPTTSLSPRGFGLYPVFVRSRHEFLPREAYDLRSGGSNDQIRLSVLPVDIRLVIDSTIGSINV